MKQKKLHYSIVFVILLIDLTLGIGTIKSYDKTALMRPTLQHFFNGTWAEQTEKYLQEHIGFHDVLFRIKSNADLFIGEKMIQGVYVTDEMLLEKLYASDIPDIVTAAEPVNQFYEETQIPTYFILVPSASEIYKTKLPANAINAEQKNRIQQIYLETVNGVHCVDAYNILSSLKDNYIYYRTDTRWTCCGAYYVYQSAIQKMGFTPVSYQKFVISHMSTEFRGNLYEKTLYNGVRADVLDRYRNESSGQITSITAYYADGQTEDRGNRLYDTTALIGDDKYQYYLGKPCQKLIIHTNIENGKKLLLYKDSFADCVVPFLIHHYSEICIVNLEQTGEDFHHVVDTSEYTQALFLCSMKNWGNLFA